MPAAVALVAPVVPVVPIRPIPPESAREEMDALSWGPMRGFVLESVRKDRTSRECPVCALRRCPTPDRCAAEFTARTWVACFDCAGTGWDSTGQDIWCPTCGGAKVLEG